MIPITRSIPIHRALRKSSRVSATLGMALLRFAVPRQLQGIGMVRRIVFAMMLVLGSLASTIGPVAQATNFYEPGQTIIGAGYRCTGGYIINGSSGSFPTTAGHCFPVGSWVAAYPPGAAGFWLGQANYSKYPAYDTELVSKCCGSDSYQIVVDPLTGRVPSPNGKVTGYYSDSQLVPGLLVGKMGSTTGWTEGNITGYLNYGGYRLYCTTARVDHGDSGGPVWRSEPNGVKALGKTLVGIPDPRHPNQLNACFSSMADELWVWGAWLPVWPSYSMSNSAAQSSQFALPGPSSLGQTPAGLRELHPKVVVPL